MSKHKSEDFVKSLPDWADEYIDFCLANTKEVATGSGKIVKIQDRHIPTIAFFLNIWLPKHKGDTITRETYYFWLRSETEKNKDKSEIIEIIDEKFKALAADIVANEGKGIFYAKNKLGWTDRMQNENTNLNIAILSIDPLDPKNDD